MTLILNTNNKPDNRMVEYSQAVVRLGLEKAELDREVQKKRCEVREISIALDLIKTAFLKDRKALTEENVKEIEKQSGVLMDYEKSVIDEEKKLEYLVLNQKQILVKIKDYEKNIESHNESLKKLSEERVKLSEVIKLLVRDKEQKEREKSVVDSFLQNSLKEKSKAVSELYELDVRKSESESALEKANKDLVELNEIISILQATNRQGLDLVASFEGERNRLREKEESLIRKEKDLLLYEKRVEKMRVDAGNTTKMVFK